MHKLYMKRTKPSSWTWGDTQKLFENAQRIYSCSAFALHVLPSTYTSSKVIIVTSKRLGNAVKRNYQRRRLKEAFYKSLLAQHSMDCIFFVRSTIVNIEFAKLVEYCNHAYNKISTAKE